MTHKVPIVHNTPPYSLEQLAEASGEQARTIRSWIKEGLLPPAQGKGRGSFYEQAHMDRLLFIRRLRKQTGVRLPLAMMRSILERLYASADPDVVRRVAHGEESLAVADLIAPVESSPPDIQMSMHREVASLVLPPEESSADYLSSCVPQPSPRSVSPPANDELFTSIQIQEDLELRLRSDEPERVAWLAKLARKLRTWIHEGEP
mgnify:FL=1